MYKFKFIPKDNEYEIHSSNFGAYRGNFLEIAKKTAKMGVDREDFVFALKEMKNKTHNIAHFGILGRFLFTERK